MSDLNLVVSGQRLAEQFSAINTDRTETVATAGEAPANAADLAALVGASVEEAMSEDGGHLESVTPEMSELEKSSLMMQFNAAVQLLQEADEEPGVFCTTENQLAAIVQSALAERAEGENKIVAAPGEGREAKFDERDLRWALMLVTWLGKLKPHGWLPLPRQVESVDRDLMLAIVGDWGTGLYGAPLCSKAIQAAGGFDYVVHLGDIYYSGTTREVKSNFLEKWPSVPGAQYRACNGNHEMYSGGYGYFDLVLPRFGQASSCFAIQNPDWLIVGLDSAFADHDLANHQNAWLKRLADAAGSRKLVLFSHHQPFSHFHGGGADLIEKLLPLLNSKRVTAWYWGHEHRCVLYDRHPRWNFFGRCIGHSGYPYFRKPSLKFAQVSRPPAVAYGFWRELPANLATGTPGALLLDGPNPHLGHHKEKYGPNGFTTLEFRGPTLTERHFLATGEELTSVVIQ